MRKFEDLVGNLGGLGGKQHLLVCSTLHAECDVVPNGRGKEKRFLRHKADRPTQRIQRPLPDGNAVEQDGSRCGVEQSGDQLNESRLSRAGWAQDGEG